MNLAKLSKIRATAALAGAAFGLMATQGAAGAAICQQVVSKYCVVIKTGVIFPAFTNSCFARQQHLRILYRGPCIFSSTVRTCKGTTCE
jgi:hypothetical protein